MPQRLPEEVSNMPSFGARLQGPHAAKPSQHAERLWFDGLFVRPQRLKADLYR